MNRKPSSTSSIKKGHGDKSEKQVTKLVRKFIGNQKRTADDIGEFNRVRQVGDEEMVRVVIPSSQTSEKHLLSSSGMLSSS